MQNKGILYLPDRIPKYSEEIPQSLRDRLHETGLLQPELETVHFCGIISFGDGQLAIFLPRNYNLASSFYKGSARLLLLTIRKFYCAKKSGVYDHTSVNNIMGGHSLSLIVLLLEDYQNNGLYVRRVKDRTRNSGKVNWPRTVSRSTVFPSQTGYVYFDLETSRTRYTDSSETSRIHASVIKSLLSIYGFLLYDNRSMFDSRLEQLSIDLSATERLISILERELRLSFSERDIFLINSLIQYLKTIRGEQPTGILIGTQNFHNVWEAMLDQCLEGNINVKLPIPVYKTVNDEFIAAPLKGQRTDTILKNERAEQYAVIDAKYYNASSVKHAPGWPDLVKQFYYQKAITKVFNVPCESVTNHFIFPGYIPFLSSAHVAHNGKVVSSEKDCLPASEYSPIMCHYQEPLELMDCYVNGGALKRLMAEIIT